jgi:hypothetical protein
MDKPTYQDFATVRKYNRYREDPEYRDRVRAASKKWWLSNRELYNRKRREKYYQPRPERKQTIRDWLWEYKKTIKCNRCDENHPACLDFHHTDPSEKDFSVASYSLKKVVDDLPVVLAEIQKCIVLCSNCHRKEHHNQRIEKMSKATKNDKTSSTRIVKGKPGVFPSGK